MSADGDDGGPGRREVAHRLFAAEFDDADLSYSESDEERAPNYVITPSGARVNRLFLVGVLTETEWVNDDMLRARIVDPTGPFVSYAGQYQPDALGFLERAEPPAFLAVTGKARTFQPEDGDRVFTSVRPESISDVDADTRDRWVVEAARRTVDRVETMAAAMETGLDGDELVAALEADGVDHPLASGIALALDHYGTTPAYLDALRQLAEDALETVAGERDEVRPLDVAPDEGGGDASALTAESISATPETDDDESDREPAAATSSDASSESESDDAAAEPEGTEDEPVSTDSVGESTDAEPVETTTTETEPAGTPASESATTTESTDTATADPEPADDELGDFEPDEELGDFDPEEDEALTEEERREVEAEFDTGFSTGNEVESEPELDPEPEPEPEPDDDPREAETDEGGADESDAEAEPVDAEDSEPAEDVSLDDAVMDAMEALDDGDGADHDELVANVTDRTGADADAVEAAIEDALMSGRCYEPDDGVLKPI